MSIVDELSRLNDLRANEGLTDLEYEEAKRELLVGNVGEVAPKSIGTLHRRLDAVDSEVKLVKLDREWQERCQQSLYVRRRYGKAEPTVAGAITSAICLFAVGLLFFVRAAAVSAVGHSPAYQRITVTLDGKTTDVNDPSVPESLRAGVTGNSQPVANPYDDQANGLTFLGVVAVIAGIFYGKSEYGKYETYTAAYKQYLKKRRELQQTSTTKRAKHVTQPVQTADVASESETRL